MSLSVLNPLDSPVSPHTHIDRTRTQRWTIGEQMGRVVDASDSDFDVVTKSDEWVLVDFWAPWCGPCKMVAPILSQIASEREITVAKVNTDVNPVSSGRFGIRGIPALMLFNNGEIVDRMTGAMPKPGMDAWLNRHMT